MRIVLTIAVCLVFSLSVLGTKVELLPVAFSSQVFAKRIVDNYPANITALSLSRTTVFAAQNQSRQQIIKVWPLVSDPGNDLLLYHFYIEGGKILGGTNKGGQNNLFVVKGSDLRSNDGQVQWDVTGLEKGEYRITAAVDDGCGLCGQTTTRTIEIIEQPPPSPELENALNCPRNVTIRANHRWALRGREMRFMVEWDGWTENLPQFNWNFQGAEVVRGQNTLFVDVLVSRNLKKPLQVKVSGNPAQGTAGCEFEAELELKKRST